MTSLDFRSSPPQSPAHLATKQRLSYPSRVYIHVRNEYTSSTNLDAQALLPYRSYKNIGRASDGRGVYVSSRQQETDNNDKTQTQTRKETQTQAQKETEVKQNWNYNTDREDVHSLRFRADRTRVDR